MSASDPAAAWLAGELEDTDIESQLRHYAAARVAVPNDRLYLASLGAFSRQTSLANFKRRVSSGVIP